MLLHARARHRLARLLADPGLRRLGGKAESWVEQSLGKTQGPVIAASDYVSAVADLIRPYVARRYVALGTDGFGRSDTRAALRRFFEVDRQHIVVAALAALAKEGIIAANVVTDALARYGIVEGAAHPWEA